MVTSEGKILRFWHPRTSKIDLFEYLSLSAIKQKDESQSGWYMKTKDIFWGRVKHCQFQVSNFWSFKKQVMNRFHLNLHSGFLIFSGMVKQNTNLKLVNFFSIWPFKSQHHKMVKHTRSIRRQQPKNCLSVFGHFVGLALKGLRILKLGLHCSLRSQSNTLCSTMRLVKRVYNPLLANIPSLYFLKTSGKF